jgi:uncharacterized protein YukE
MEIKIALRVTPEELRTQKNVVQADLDNMRNDINQITTEIRGTSSYWLGEAGNKQRDEYENRVQGIDQMLVRLQSYPDRLLKMAGIYENAEGINKVTASQMTTDIEMI